MISCIISSSCSIGLAYQVCDHVIYGYFGVELCIKILAMGVLGRGCYLSETWNRLDFFIVLAGYYIFNLILSDLHFLPKSLVL